MLVASAMIFRAAKVLFNCSKIRKERKKTSLQHEKKKKIDFYALFH
jgi:hypothetical protein